MATMNMNGFEIIRSKSVCYGDEIVSSSWNLTPALQPGDEQPGALAACMIGIDAEEFLNRMCACRH